VIFEFITAAKKSCWSPCGLVGRYQRFVETYCLHLQPILCHNVLFYSAQKFHSKMFLIFKSITVHRISRSAGQYCCFIFGRCCVQILAGRLAIPPSKCWGRILKYTMTASFPPSFPIHYSLMSHHSMLASEAIESVVKLANNNTINTKEHLYDTLHIFYGRWRQ
jgi:hypothetical protein